MTTSSYEQAFPSPRRSFLPAWALQWGTWLLACALIIGPFIPLFYASIRDRPLYEDGGVLTLQPYRDLFGYTALWGYIQKQGWDELQKIGKSRLRAQTGVAGQQSLVSQGAATAAFLTSPTVRLNIKNSPALSNILDWTYSKDATPLVPRGMGITKKAASPASAKLFLNWLYSKAGQQAMCDAGFTAFRNNFKPKNCTNTLADVYAKVGRKNVQFVPYSQKFVNDYPAYKKRWHNIFG